MRSKEGITRIKIATLAFLPLLSLLSDIPGCWSVILPALPRVVRTPEFRFANLPKLGYPWAASYLHLKLNGLSTLRMHYLDLGPSNAPETILLLHGTPAWSFLYRKMIPILLDAGYRVIAPDHIGFGRSDKLTDPEEYTHELHVSSVLELVRFLDLQGVTLFGQDLGGPTGLSVVRQESGRFKRLVLLNTWIPQGDIFSSLPFALRHIPYLTWRITTRFLRRAVPVGLVFTVASNAPPTGVIGYMTPYPSFAFKAGPAQWPLFIPLTKDDSVALEMQRVKQFLQTQWTGPVLYGYSDRELFTTPGRDLFRELFKSNGCEVKIQDSGHFVQEDQADVVSLLVIDFINRGC